MGVHILAARYIERPVHIALAGVGGNGSQILSGLARLAAAMRALGHPGVNVTAYDPDTVTHANVGRQLFYASDVGLNKAIVAVHRVNQAFGTAWEAFPIAFTAHPGVDMVVSCVDTRCARIDIDRRARHAGGRYWLDLGNRETDGQAILGEWPGHAATIRKTSAVGVSDFDATKVQIVDRLPTVLELFPEILTTNDADDTAPSCSLAEAIERQGLFTNQDVVTAALLILETLFRHGRIDWHGAFTNSRTGRRTTLPVDPEAWARMGLNTKRKRAR